MTLATIGLQKLKSNQVFGWSSDTGAVAAADVFMGRSAAGAVSFSANSDLSSPVLTIRTQPVADPVLYPVDSYIFGVIHLPATLSQETQGLRILHYLNGAHSNKPVTGCEIDLLGIEAGGTYTGSAGTKCFSGLNNAASTATAYLSSIEEWTGGNTGGHFVCNGLTAGASVGGVGAAFQSTYLNIGLLGHSNINDGITNKKVGVMGVARYGAVEIGGCFGLFDRLNNIEATITASLTSCALLVDNSDRPKPIAIFRDNGTAVLTLADDGGSAGTNLLTLTGTFKQTAPAGLSGYLQTNAGSLASQTALNPGILFFHSGATPEYGVDLGYNGGFRTRVFAAASTAIAFAFTNTTPTAQSHFTEAMTLTDTGVCTFPINGSSIVATGTGANGLVLKNLKNDATATVSGTPITVYIDIAGATKRILAYPSA